MSARTAGAGRKRRQQPTGRLPPPRLSSTLRVPCQGALLSLVEIQAGKLSLQPEALGADQEATNGLKHPEKRLRKGVSGPCGPQRE